VTASMVGWSGSFKKAIAIKCCGNSVARSAKRQTADAEGHLKILYVDDNDDNITC
jgi:hypothetical protein